MDAHAGFRDAVLRGDMDAVVAMLADDVVFRSPAVHEPYHGREATGAILRAVGDAFEDFRYVQELHGDGTAALVFETRVGDRDVHGCDFLRFGDDGRITELTVMIRPFTALQATLEAVGARLGA